ncbi:MAG: DNA primase [Thermodesulfobacteriota bacterium]|nr:DNA primase [Thermodesulfobacteriota bacterium]
MGKEDIIRIKEATDIVGIISEHVALNRKGRTYWGLCPFHDEKTPSFSVDPERRMYKCFGCGAGGDVISFYMEIKGLEFKEAIQELAARAGIEIETGATRTRGPISEARACYDANRLAMDFFHHNLFTPGGAQGLAYLKKRGLSEETIRHFVLGFAPDSWDSLIRVLKKQGISLDTAFKAGLIIKRQSGGYYDRFRGRVIFPIKDLNNEVAGFGGRVMGEGEPKYLNTPETPIFKKRSLLYNLLEARGMIRSEGVTIVEGYMDVISLYNHGFYACVATLGTALSQEHVRLLGRFGREITLVFDGDEAGKKAMKRTSEAFMHAEIIPRAVALPDGSDPDDIATRDMGQWKKMLFDASSLWDFIFDESFSSRNTSKLGDQRAIIGELSPLIAQLKDQVVRDLLVQRLSERLGVRPDIIRGQMGAGASRTSQGQLNHEKHNILEETLVRLMLFDEDAIRVVDQLSIGKEIQDKEISSLVEYLLVHGKKVLEDMDCPEDVRVLASRLIASGAFEGDRQKALRDTVGRLLRIRNQRQLHDIQARIRDVDKGGDRESLKKLMQEMKALTQEKKDIDNTVLEVLEKR